MKTLIKKIAGLGVLTLCLVPSQLFAQGLPDALTALTIHSDAFEGTATRLATKPRAEGLLDLNEKFNQAAANLKSKNSHCYSYLTEILSRMGKSPGMQALHGLNCTVNAKLIQESKPESCDFSLEVKTTAPADIDSFTLIVHSEDDLHGHRAMKLIDSQILRNLGARKKPTASPSDRERETNREAAKNIFIYREK